MVLFRFPVWVFKFEGEIMFGVEGEKEKEREREREREDEFILMVFRILVWVN